MSSKEPLAGSIHERPRSRSRNDEGSSLASVIVSIVLFGIVATSAGANYYRGTTAVYQARAHADAAGVLAWHVAEFRDDPATCNGTPKTITTLGPDKLIPPAGFTVTCQPEASMLWPPAPCADSDCVLTEQQDIEPLTVTVAWNARGPQRTMTHTLISSGP